VTVPVFPTLAGLTWPVKKAPVFNNTRVAANWGRRSVVPNRVLPIWSYELEFSILRSEAGFLEFQQLLNVYLKTFGGALYFNFNDVNDNAVTLEPSGTGDGTSTAFELVRALPTVGFAEPVRSFNGTPHIFVNGTEVFNWSIDATGIVNFTGPPGAGAVITWTGAYYWLCRFDEDMLPLSNFVKNWWECKSVKFSTDLLG
jgi:hypothetical protein